MTTAVLNRLTSIRASYARRRSLLRELALYDTPGALSDLEAAAARCQVEGNPETVRVRRMIETQRALVTSRAS